MSNNKVDIVGLNTSNILVLKNSETQELLLKYHQGDMNAYNRIIEGNLKLVLSVVRKFKDRKENLDDLFQVGCLGLIKSIKNFDVSQKVFFSTYAVPMIIGEIRRYLRDNTQLRVSRQLKDLAYLALKSKEKYVEENNKEPTTEELAQILNVTTFAIKEALDSAQSVSSIYEPIYSDNGDTLFLFDQIADDNISEEKTANSISLEKAMSALNDFQKYVITKRYYEDKTQMEIAQEFDISQAQVSRIEKSALKILKAYF